MMSAMAIRPMMPAGMPFDCDSNIKSFVVSGSHNSNRPEYNTVSSEVMKSDQQPTSAVDLI
jgi:hypothetical protein